MTSSTLAGERRWASARRGGMTVLGKVAVPKPLNLPSQRLENHGLDPNVEIVPKGTLSWGSRSSSAAQNAWGSSMHSPSPDSSTNSPSHPSACPSSGGSGTRPSTSGSDRQIEPTGNAWGPNSRPSSSSGLFASNHSSLTSLRPRSAEARPASSQLSQFAEPVSDSPGAWDGSVTTEKLGVLSSKKDEFSLSSGDFPSLGSDKDYPGKSNESKDSSPHGRPSSASGRVSQAKDKTTTSHPDGTCGAVNMGKKDGSRNVGDEVLPSMERWQGEPQHYFNPNVPSQHFDVWRGPPMNTPAGVWFRGPPGAPPYGAPIRPGGFPMEPFPYYHPQIPPPAFANSQPVPPPRAGPRGHHPKSGNPFRPQIPDAYVRPGLPFRPGFYPIPMAFEGYYGPPMGYCNSNERDTPYMGMSASPSVYERYSGPNVPDPSDYYARAGRPGPAGKIISDDAESAHSGDARGSYKVLLKQHNEGDGKEQEENHRHLLPANALLPAKGEKAGIILRKYEWGAEDDEEDGIYSSDNFENRGSYVSDAGQAKYSQSSKGVTATDDCLIKKSESDTSPASQLPQVSTSNGKDSSVPSSANNATLLQKLEGLNAKVRASDERAHNASSGEEHNSGSNAANANADISTNEVSNSAASFEGPSASGYFAPTSQQVVVAVGDDMAQPTAAVSRRLYHGMPSRTDHRGKGKFSNQDADGGRRKLNPSKVLSSKVEFSCNLQERDHHQAVEAAEDNPPAKDERQPVTDMHDSTDSLVQRARMRELAKQRAIQLQKEEEERIRQQKAKAQAKLEELNRRMQSGGALNQTGKKPLAGGTSQEQEVRDMAPIESITKFEASSLVLPLKTEVVSRINDSSAYQVTGSAIPSKALPVEISNTKKLESVRRDESVPLKQDTANAGAGDGKSALQLNEGGASRHKHISYKLKQITTVQKKLNEKSIPDGAREVQEPHVDMPFNVAAANVVASSEIKPALCSNSSTVSESSAPQRRKTNKSSRNKNKQDAPSIPTLTADVPNESVPIEKSDENVECQASNLNISFGSIQAAVNNESGVELSEKQSLVMSEESHGRVNHQWKPQHSRRTPRNQQVNRFVEKFHGHDAVIWAPVRSENKAVNEVEAAFEGDRKQIVLSVTPAKCDNLVQNSPKNKRAEIERYVPKPVVKELAQHVGMQQSVSLSDNKSTPYKTASQQPFRSATENIGCSLEPKEAVTKPNKHAKVTGAWRQRGSMKILNVKNVERGSSSLSDASKSPEEAIHKNLPLSHEANSAEAERETSSELNASDSWNVSTTYDASAPDTSTVLKDQGGKGKRHPSRGRRNVGNSHNLDNNNASSDNKTASSAKTDETHIQSPATDISQPDSGVASKETCGIGERMSSHWQPKSHAYSAGFEKGSMSNGSQIVGSETGRVVRRDYPCQQRVKTPPQHDENRNQIEGPQLDQYVSTSKVAREVPKTGNYEPKRERKFTSSKGRPYSPNQNPVLADVSTSASSNHTQPDQQFSASSKRDGNQINRSGRVHESRGDWSGQDNRQHNMPVNWDRQGNNVHYEYQPVGSNNNNTSKNFQAQGDGSRNAGPRYREKGRSHPKRGGGNFYARESGALHVDAGCD